MAKDRHTPTDKSRAAVAALLSFGVKQDDVAAHIGISGPTLRKHYTEEINLSSIKANAAVASYLFSLASGKALKDEEAPATHSDCKTAAMFWLKTRANWRETANLELTGKDGGPVQTEEVGAGHAKLTAFLDAIAERSGEAG